MSGQLEALGKIYSSSILAGIITPAPVSQKKVHNNSSSSSTATQIIKHLPIVPSSWDAGVNL
jgi:hypothetical protein